MELLRNQLWNSLDFNLIVLDEPIKLDLSLMSYFIRCQEETEVKPPPQPKLVETWRRRSPRRQSDDDRVPRRRVSPERNPRYEEAPLPRENAWEKHSLIKESLSSEETVCNGTPSMYLKHLY